MIKKRLLFLFFMTTLFAVAQTKKDYFALSFSSGLGSEFHNTDYTFTNHFYKAGLNYRIKDGRYFEYEVLVQPEINFATHQLLNLYFVKPQDPDYLVKRAEYTKLKNVREYVLNLGFLVRKPIGKNFSVYILGSIGPMLNDTETERISKGFAFADVLAIGFSARLKDFQLDIRPNIRHVSNAGLNSENAGYNTRNIEFGISYYL